MKEKEAIYVAISHSSTKRSSASAIISILLIIIIFNQMLLSHIAKCERGTVAITQLVLNRLSLRTCYTMRSGPYSALERQRAVTAYVKSKQLPFTSNTSLLLCITYWCHGHHRAEDVVHDQEDTWSRPCYWTSVVLMFGRRRRRRANIKTTLVQHASKSSIEK